MSKGKNKSDVGDGVAVETKANEVTITITGNALRRLRGIVQWYSDARDEEEAISRLAPGLGWLAVEYDENDPRQKYEVAKAISDYVIQSMQEVGEIGEDTAKESASELAAFVFAADRQRSIA